MKGRAGFSLIEIVVVIAVISILAGMAAPYAVQYIDSARETRAKEEVRAIYDAIVGDPAAQRSGYLCDMGRLPTAVTSLGELVARGMTQPVPATGTLGVRYGWNGPYLNVAPALGNQINDPWGNAYRLNTTILAQPLQVVCWGKDKSAGTVDDIVYPPNPVPVLGSLQVNVHVWDTAGGGQFVQNPRRTGGGGGGGGGYPGATGTVTLYTTTAGGTGETPVSRTLVANGPGPYTFPGCPAGLHAVTGTFDIGGAPRTGQATAYVPPNGQAQLNLYVR